MRIFATIDKEHLKYNVEHIRSIVENREIMAVVKANAYGHGDLLVVKALEEMGVNMFAVASLEEAVNIRSVSPDIYILIIGATQPEELKQACDLNIAYTLHNRESMEAALPYKDKGRFHLQIDTGMHRAGLSAKECRTWLPLIEKLKPEGIYTHLATADEEDHQYTKRQISTFEGVVRDFQKSGFDFSMIHYANSGGALFHTLGLSNVVRPGIMLYGIDPRGEESSLLGLKPILEVTSKVVAVRTVEEGESVGYGRRFRASSTKNIATVAIGYADGYHRNLTGQAQVWIKGEFRPVVGSVTMDYIMVDTTGLKVSPGDEVEILGPHISAARLAHWAQTVPHEICTSLSQRVIRRYKEKG